MRVRFILGRAGTGKSELCLREISEKAGQDPLGPPLLLLVPEQSTFQSELALGLKMGNGLGRAQVVSFQRLGWMVLQEAGGSSKPFLSETGRQMFLEHILVRFKNELKAFRDYPRRPELALALGKTIRQVKQAGVTPELLEEEAVKWAEARPLLAAKLSDLSFIIKELSRNIRKHSFDPDDYLELVAAKIPQCPSLQKAEVWVDGFSGFTSQELKVLESLIVATQQVNIVLCLAPEYWKSEAAEGDLFYRTWRTFKGLRKLIEECGAETLPPCFLTEPHRFASTQELAHLEKHWEVWPRPSYEGKTDKIEIVAAASREMEVEWAAESVLRLVRHQGFRFRDILIMTRDLSSYAPFIRRVFSSLEIPCFIDQKPPIDAHPLTVLVLTALEIASLNWPNNAVFRYLKTGLTGIEEDEIDRLENYVLASGINGSTWKNTWQYRPRSLFREINDVDVENELKVINLIREKVVSPLLRLEEGLKKAGKAAEMSLAVWEFLEQLKVKDAVDNLIYQAQKDGKPQEGQEHAAVYQSINYLLQEISLAFADHPMTVKEYLNSLQAGMKAATVGLIPPGLDQVMVGSMDRSRYSEAKAVFILGANEGVLPAVPASDGVLGEADLEHLQLGGLDLPLARLKAFEEPFLIYTALTKSRCFLTVSYALADSDGTPLVPSPVIKDLKAMFPGIKETFRSWETLITKEEPEELLHPFQAFNLLAAQYSGGRELPCFWQEVRESLRHKPGYDRRLGVLEKAKSFDLKERLSVDAARRLFSHAFSVTDLEKYAACPYAFFLERGLKARERALAELKATDIGQFFHAMAKEFLLDLKKLAPEGWDTLNEEKVEKTLEEALLEVEKELEQEIKLASPRGQYLKERLKRTAKEAGLICWKQIMAGKFLPGWLEMPFTLKIPEQEKGPGADASETCLLAGRIDRVDVCENNGKVWLRIIDYKSRSWGIDLGKLYHGLSLQLFLYMEAALDRARREYAAGTPEVAGVFFFPIEKTLVNKNVLEEKDLEAELMKQRRLRGLMLKDLKVASLMDKEIKQGPSLVVPFSLTQDGNFYQNSTSVLEGQRLKLLKDYAVTMARRLMALIREGEIGITPYRMANQKACDFCLYKPVCQFDETMGHRYRRLKKLGNKGFWNQVEDERKVNPGGEKVD